MGEGSRSDPRSGPLQRLNEKREARSPDGLCSVRNAPGRLLEQVDDHKGVELRNGMAARKHTQLLFFF